MYTLSGDTPKHMKCTRNNGCFRFWPPVTVKGRASKAAGVKGKLGTFKRNGFTQVTLNGHPLYTYAGDGNRAGVVNGNGIKTFGGTWHVVTAGKASAACGAGPHAGLRRRLVADRSLTVADRDHRSGAPRRRPRGPPVVVGGAITLH